MSRFSIQIQRFIFLSFIYVLILNMEIFQVKIATYKLFASSEFYTKVCNFSYNWNYIQPSSYLKRLNKFMLESHIENRKPALSIQICVIWAQSIWDCRLSWPKVVSAQGVISTVKRARPRAYLALSEQGNYLRCAAPQYTGVGPSPPRVVLFLIRAYMNIYTEENTRCGALKENNIIPQNLCLKIMFDCVSAK